MEVTKKILKELGTMLLGSIGILLTGVALYALVNLIILIIETNTYKYIPLVIWWIIMSHALGEIMINIHKHYKKER